MNREIILVSMSEIVFILGAGASRDAGAPLMANFLETAERLQRKPPLASPHTETIVRAVDELQQVFSKATLDIQNIESVYGAIEMARLIGRYPGLQETEIENLSQAINGMIVHTLEQTILYPLRERHLQPTQSYRQFVELVSKLNGSSAGGGCSILTFNYDVALDFALFSKGCPADYWLEPRTTTNWRCTKLLKLHGSLNWGRCKSCGKVLPLTFDQRFKGKMYIEDSGEVPLEMAKYIPNILQCCANPVGPTPLLVPPTWNKTEYHASLRNVWRQAANELGEAERIYVSGYSLPESDTFFRYLYALGSLSKKRLKCFTVSLLSKTGEGCELGY